MKKIRLSKNEVYNYVHIQQGEREIAIIDLKELKDFINNYDKDICYFENKY